MSRYPANGPTWGVLAKAPVDEVKRLMLALADQFDLEQFVYRTSGSWSAVFNMEPGSTGDKDAAEILKDHGFAPIYHFDFNRYEYNTLCWDGTSWREDDDPANVCNAHGIEIPGWESVGKEPPIAPVPPPRRASVLEGTMVEEARSLVDDEQVRIALGPRGAIVYDAHVNTRIRLWDTAPQRVFELLFYPDSSAFYFTVMKGDQCLGTFRPGETRTWDATPFLADVEGETSPERIIDLFGIERSFLEPDDKARTS